MRRVSRLGCLAICVLLIGSTRASDPPADSNVRVAPELLQSLEYRSLGPYRGGRVTAVAGVVQDPRTFYMGATGGGVWKTSDGGETWVNVSDEAFKAGSIGAVAVAPSDPNVVYAGTGSACIRGNVSPGIGIYKSEDAGKTWKHVGLSDAGQIGRIRVHPSNPDLVYVAALGHAFGPNPERGVFRSWDGGDTWQKVLYVGEKAGAVDLAMDPVNPRILFAATWEAVRRPWTMISGGEGSGLYRSTDGGDTWKELTEGLPEGIKGRIGVAVSAARPGRVWALVEAEQGGLFLSDDGGDHFRRVNDDRNFRQRAWYYTHVYADPNHADTVYVLNVGLWRSTDRGREFDFIRAPHGDHHDLWIHPQDSNILINGNDGGANVSYDGGRTWSTQANQPTAEIYRLTVDRRKPYWIYGSQQDNSSLAMASRSFRSGITVRDWYPIGGCESGHVAVDPRDPNITYSGCYGGTIGRYDARTGQEREIMAYPQLAVGQAAKDLKYRFQWNAPIRISPHDPNVLYHCSQFVHRSTDEGQSWEIISPDLTRNDPSKQDYAGGPITRDNTGVEVYDTIFAFEESPHQAGLLWVGTDDGLVHLSRDGGTHWEAFTPAKMPEWATVNTIELSPHAPGRALLAVHRYRLDDFRPYIFLTNDYGKHWKLLTDGRNGIPEDHFVRVVREDPVRRGLLYAGTEFGVYVSFDEGDHWQSLQRNLPVTPVTDMAVRDGDLVVSTQGRGFWILDDLSPLRQARAGLEKSSLHVFEPRDAVRFGGGGGRGASRAGKNPPNGAILHYSLKQEATDDEPLVLEILDAEGRVLRRLSSAEDEPRAPSPWLRFFPEMARGRRLPAKAGANRYVWDLRIRDASLVDDAVLWGLARGPRVPPGRYTARFSLGDDVQAVTVRVVRDPRLDVSDADLEAQYALARRTWELLNRSHALLRRVRDARDQVRGWTERLEALDGRDTLREQGLRLAEALDGFEGRITQPRSRSSQDVLNFPPGLDNQILQLLGVITSAEAPPTRGAEQRYRDLEQDLDGVERDFESWLQESLAPWSAALRDAGLDPVTPLPPAAPEF